MSDPNVKNLPIYDLTCCCCGNITRGRQWWNRDVGYGLCVDCIDYCGANVPEGVEARSYGIRGLHFDIKE